MAGETDDNRPAAVPLKSIPSEQKAKIEELERWEEEW